jgi:hypothetical protein
MECVGGKISQPSFGFSRLSPVISLFPELQFPVFQKVFRRLVL